MGALVFGGSGALGGAVCRALAAKGARVAFTYLRNESKAIALARELPGALAYPLDLRSVPDLEATVDRAAAALGGIDAFVQCAGVAITMECSGPGAHHRMPQVDEGGWDWMMDVNAKSTFFAVRRVVPVMREGGGGNLIFVGSVDGVKNAPSPVHYAASKGALRGMVGAMAKEFGEFKIRVNMVAPGLLDGGLSRDIPPNLLKEYVKHCGLKRLGRFEEIAAVISWLALENTYVTGQTILADGAL